MRLFRLRVHDRAGVQVDSINPFINLPTNLTAFIDLQPITILGNNRIKEKYCITRLIVDVADNSADGSAKECKKKNMEIPCDNATFRIL